MYGTSSRRLAIKYLLSLSGGVYRVGFEAPFEKIDRHQQLLRTIADLSRFTRHSFMFLLYGIDYSLKRRSS
jgi:hypothetical protein